MKEYVVSGSELEVIVNKIDLNKFPEGSKIIKNAKGVDVVVIPYDPKYEEKMARASSPKKIYKKIIMHG